MSLIDHPVERRTLRHTSQWLEVDQNLEDTLRRTTKPIRIARTGRLFPRAEQADQRVELVGKRDSGPRHGSLTKLRFRRGRVGFDAMRQVVVVDRLPDFFGLTFHAS